MKKDLIFTPAMLLVGALLFMLRVTGMGAHIFVAIVGIFILGIYTSLTRKEWKIPALEVVMRAFYGIALITGVVVMKVHGVIALSIVHKASAALFMLLLVVLFVTKLVSKKNK